ncbi:putative acyltransferase [Obelidium mucronatum]|nr:putative acyltransferase [Obelidium mucronatum]
MGGIWRVYSLFYFFKGWQGYHNPIGAPIFYPEYTTEIKDALVSSNRLKQTVRMLAIKKVASEAEKHVSASGGGTDSNTSSRRLKRAEHEVWEQANSIIDGMIANMDSTKELKVIAFLMHYMLVQMYHQGIHIREREFLELKKTAEYAQANKMSLIFLPCHKSHVDYLVISYIFYRLGLALPHIAAGENLNMPAVGHLLKHCGAFFIRRVWGDDPLYGAIMKEYIEVLLCRGHNIEAFTEGTRSRIGKLLQPKFGIMKIIMEAVLSGRVNDCIIVPMSIGYDKVIETGSYVSELLGAPKEKESLYQLLTNMNVLNFKWGRIDISFSRAFSLKEYVGSQTMRRGVRLNPRSSVEDKNLLLQTLGFRVLAEINKISVIMPTALVGTVILTLRGRGVGRDELIRKVDWLKRVINLRGGAVADFGGKSTGWVVDRAIQVLRDLIGQRTDLLEPVFYPVKRFELSFYRNQVIHLFITESILSCALYATVKQGGPVHIQKVKIFPDLENDCGFLSKLLKSEFIYGPHGLRKNMLKTIDDMVTLNVMSTEVEMVNGVATGSKLLSLSQEERRIGRETFDFFCFLLWPFLETYWLSAISCFALIPPKLPSSELVWVDERLFYDQAQFLGKTLYYEGDLSYFEAVNKETLKNGFQRLKDMGVLISRKVKRGGADNVPVVALASEWSPQDTFDEKWRHFMPEGRLWELCEQIGKFRREGKNRRDTATVATRVLSLASAAGISLMEANIVTGKL